MSDVQGKLLNELTDHLREKSEFENTITNLKKEICNYKWKLYATEIQLNALSKNPARDQFLMDPRIPYRFFLMNTSEENSSIETKNCDIQTNNADSTEKTINKGTALGITCKNEALSKEIKDLIHEFSSKVVLELQKLKATTDKSVRDRFLIDPRIPVRFLGTDSAQNLNIGIENSVVKTIDAKSTEKMKNEVATLGVISANKGLSKEIEDLIQEFSSKIMLLQSCHCRLLPTQDKAKQGEKSSKRSRSISNWCHNS